MDFGHLTGGIEGYREGMGQGQGLLDQDTVSLHSYTDFSVISNEFIHLVAGLSETEITSPFKLTS